MAVVELGVEAALRQQGIVVALLHDMAVLHHEDDVGLPDGGKAVCHDEAGAALHHPGKGCLDTHLGAGVDGGGGLVQNQHRGQTEHHAGDAEQLLLALADVAAVLGDDGVVALGQAADEAVGMGCLGRCHHLFEGGIRLAVGDVLPHGAGPEPGILQHHAVAAAQGGAGHVPDVGAGDFDGAAVDIIEPHEQVDEGGLAAAGGADDGDALAGLDVQRQTLDERAVGQIAEGDVLDLDVAVRHELCGVLRFGGLVFSVQQLEHAGCAGQSVLQLGHDAGNFVEGLGVLVGVVQEDAQLADGDASGYGIDRAHEADACVDDVVDEAGGGVGHAGEEDGLQAHVLQAAIHLVKSLEALGLVAEGLHDLLPLYHLVDKGSLLAAHGALALEILVAALCEKAGHHEAQGGDADHHQRDGDILLQHEEQGAEDGQHTREQLGEAHQQAVREGIHIGHHPAHDVAGWMAVEVREGKGLDLPHGGVAQVTADCEGDAVVADAQQPLRKGGDNRHHDDLVDDAQHAREVHGTFAQHHVDGTAAEDGDIQLGRHAHSGHDEAAHHEEAVGLDFLQHPGHGGLLLFRGQLAFCFCTHFCASPFLNWLS